MSKYNSKQEFLTELAERLAELKVENADEIIAKYARQLDIAEEAGLSLDEAIERIGSVDKIVAGFSTNKKRYDLKICSAIIDNLVIRLGSNQGIIVNVDDSISNYLTIEKAESSLSIKDDKEIIRRKKGNIEIIIGPDVEFKKVELDLVSTDIEIEKLVADQIVLNSVSGDMNIKRIDTDSLNISLVSGDCDLNFAKVNECKLSTVSGDVEFRYLEAENVDASTISGDINIRGKLSKRHFSSITGDIYYYDVNKEDQ